MLTVEIDQQILSLAIHCWYHTKPFGPIADLKDSRSMYPFIRRYYYNMRFIQAIYSIFLTYLNIIALKIKVFDSK
jgi:hypothetical protein